MVDYKAIADAAAVYPDYQAAFDAMSVELDPITYNSLTSNQMKVWAASNPADYQTLKSASDTSSQLAVLKVDAENGSLEVGDVEVQAFINTLLITQAGKDDIYARAAKQDPVWPGLKPGHVQNAIQKRSEGLV